MVLRAWAADSLAPEAEVAAALARLRNLCDDPAGDPTTLSDADWVALLGADGTQLAELAALADDTRRAVSDHPDALTFVVNRNFDTAVVGSAVLPGGGASAARVEDLVHEAWELGATEICLQGPLPANAPADGYLRLIDLIHTAEPGIHLHALRPTEIRDAAERMGIDFADFLGRAQAAGLGSVPGTAAQILDDDVRAVLSGGQAPPVEDWVQVIDAAHRSGLFSTATMLYGHVETREHQVAHLRHLVDIQERTRGFSELILMPLLPQQAPPPVADAAVATATVRETRALHAVARLLTVGRIDHLQVAWTKVPAPVVDQLLRGGADDIGGLLLDGQLDPAAGQEAGRVLDIEQLDGFAERAGRVPRQRTTGYRNPPTDRLYRGRTAHR